MSADQTGDTRNARVIELRPAVPADGQPVLTGTVIPAAVPAAEPGARRPVIPLQWQRANLAGTLRHKRALLWHQARYHALRLPKYLALYLWHAAIGTGVLTGRLFAWWQATGLWQLESAAVAAGRPGHADAMRAHERGLKTRAQRTRIVAGFTAIAVAGLLCMARWSPRWGWGLLAAAVVLVLSRHGHGPGRRVVQPAVVPAALEPITLDVVVRALGSLGLAGINQVLREGREIAFIPPGAHRDGPGWRVDMDLPYGVTAGEVIERRDKFASGLRRPIGCVWPEPDAGQHEGRLILFVGDEPLSKAKQPAWPLAHGGKVSLFRPVPFGTDQRGKPVTVLLMFANLLIGSIPRMGKTVAMRVVMLAAALDVLAELHIHELKGTGDLEPLARVAHAYGSGADDDTIRRCLEDLRKVYRELERRAEVIRKLPKADCPESKVTPELAAKRGLRLHPLVFAIDECQEAFAHEDYGKEFEKLALGVIKRGPALGIILILATQRPDAKSLPPGVTANVAMRFALRVMDQVANDMILGTSAYKRGINSTLLALSDKGVGWAVGFADAAMILKTYGIDGPAAERVTAMARTMREAAGTLSGFALGQDDELAPRSFAVDVLAVLGGDPKLYCSTIAARLADRIPGVYADITQEAVASQLRQLGVEVKNVREAGGPPRKGCERTAIEAVTP